MKSEINCPILNNEKFSKEILTDLVSSLEQLDIIKNTIFNRLNTAFTERVNKFCSLKSRINRVNEIISKFPTIKEAITLKSSFQYPTQDHKYYIPTIIDQNATSEKKAPNLRLNKVVLNEKSKLGSKSLASKEKINIYDQYLSCATQYDDLVNELNKVSKKEAKLRQCYKEFQPILNTVMSDFTYGFNVKIEYAKKERIPTKEINRKSNSDALQELLNEQEEEIKKRKKTIQEAPKSILEREKIKKKKEKTKKIKTEKPKFNLDIPTDIGLGGVTELDGVEDDNEDEDKKEENNEEEEEDDDAFKDDNENEIQTDPQLENQENEPLPIDYIRHNNESKYESINISPTPNYKTSNYQKPIYNANTSNNINTNTSPIQNPPPQQSNPNINSQPPTQNVINNPISAPTTSDNQILANNSGVVPPTTSTKQIVINNSGSVPQTTSTNHIVSNNSGAVPPPPPPPPSVPIIATKINKVNAQPKLSDENNSEQQEGKSIADLIASQKNHLKPISSLPKKEEIKPSKPSIKDILKKQLQWRFYQLNLHEKDNNEDDDNEEDENDEDFKV